MADSFLDTLKEFAFPTGSMDNLRNSMRQQMGMPNGLPPSGSRNPGTRASAPLTQEQQLQLGITKDAPVVPDPVVTPEQKLAADLDVIGQALQDPNTLAAVTVARERGNSLATDNQVLQDRANLSPVEFYRKYGPEVDQAMTALDVGAKHVRDFAGSERDNLTAVADSIIAAGSGAVQGAGNLGVLGLGLVNDQAGVAAAQAMQGVKEFADGLQSETMQKHRFVDQIRAGLDSADNEKAYQADKKQHGSFIATMRSLARGVASGTGRLVEDPMMATNLVAEGGGSMLVGGPIAKGVQKGATAALGLRGAAATGAGARAAQEAIERAAMPSVIAGMEAGGAYAGTAQEIMNTDDAVLKAQSPRYAELRKTMSERDAKVELASEAGLTAATITAPVAALTGMAVSKFEANPLAQVMNAPGKAAVNIGKETLEEGIQSGTGEFAGNVGMVTSGANPNQNLSQGVGDAIAQGAVAGAGSAAVLQSPGVGASAAAAAGRAAYDATLGKLAERAEAVRQENQKSSAVSQERVAQDIQAAIEATPAVVENVRNLVEENQEKISPDNQPQINDYISRIETALTDASDFERLPENLRQALVNEDGAPMNRFEAASTLSALVGDENVPPPVRIAAGLFVLNTINKNRALIDETPEFLDEISDDHAAKKSLRDFQDTLAGMEQVPGFQQTLDWIQKKLPDEVAKIDPKAIDASTPEGRQTVDNVVQLAQVRPQALNEPLVAGILQQAKDGGIPLTEEQRRLLRGVPALLQANQAAEEILASDDAVEDKKENGTDWVGRQIETAGGSKSHMLSLKQHFDRVVLPIMQGDGKTARANAQRLALFAQSHANKVEALNASLAHGDGRNVPYQALAPDGSFFTAKGIGVKRGSKGGERFARQVHAEAVALANLVNGFARAYPALGLKQVLVPSLNLDQANQNQEGESSTPTTSAQAEPSPSENPQPAQPQAPEAPASEDTPPATTQEEAPKKAEAAAAPTQERSETTEPAQGAVSPAGDVELKAEDTVQEESSEDGSEPKAETIETAFPNLKQSKGRNLFHKAYRLPKQAISRLRNLDNPLKDLRKLFGNINQLIEYLGVTSSSEAFPISNPNENDLSNYQDYMALGQAVLDEVKARLEKYAKQERKQQNGKVKESLEAILNNPDDSRDVFTFVEGRTLTLTEDGPNGIQYNEQLIQSAVLAGLDWVLNGSQMAGTLDRQDVAEILGVDESEVTAEDEEALNRGMSLDMAKKTLGETILKFWGLQADPTVSDSYVRGIVDGLAAEILVGLEASGLIENGVYERPVTPESGQTENKKFLRVWFDDRPEEIDTLVEELKQAPGVLAEAALIEPERRGPHIGSPPEKVAPTQLRNRLVKNTRMGMKAIEHRQNVPFHVNFTMFDFMSAMGKDAFVSFMGGQKFSEGDLNKEHAKSLEGKNRQLETSYKNMLAQVAQVQKYAEANGIDPRDVPSYFAYEISRVGRLQMVGDSNPQADKLTREIFMPTRAVLDLTNEADIGRFWLTVAQGIGIKVERETRASAMQKAMDKLAKPEFEAILDQLKTWLENRNNGKIENLSSNLVNDIKAALGNDLSMHAVHSLVSVAKAQLAEQNGEDLAKFETFNYLEADGKTNGPINALMLLTTGEFTADWVELVAKGGVFLGRQAKALSQATETEAVDLYERVANLLQDKQNQLAQDFRGKPRLQTQYHAFRDLWGELGANMEFQPDGKVKIKRGLTKNPLTITIYGSGVDGIAGKVTDELVKELYEQMSAIIAQGQKGSVRDLLDKDFAQSLKLLLTGEMGRTKKDQKPYVKPAESWTERWTNPETGKKEPVEVTPEQAFNRMLKMDPVEFRMDPNLYRILKSNVRVLLVDQLNEAIQEGVMGNVRESTAALQKATQIQSIVLRSLFRNRVIKKIAEKQANPQKYPDYHRGDALSRREVDEILKDLMPFSPFIETGPQRFFMAGGETSNLFETVDLGDGVKVSLPREYARALSNDMSSPAYMYGPTLAGVRGVPSLVIGSGDATMMLYAAQLGVGGLDVFDGLNMPADKIDEWGEKMNQAVHMAWQHNPMRAVAESFASFLRNDPFLELTSKDPLNTQGEAWVREANKALLGKRNPSPDEEMDAEGLVQAMQALATSLNDMADGIDDRQKVLKEFPLSIDQMASAEAPYTQAGTLEFQDEPSAVDLEEALNARLLEVQARRQMKKDEREAVETGTKEFKAAVEQFTTLDLDTGARIATRQNIKNILKSTASKMTGTQREMFYAALDALSGSGYKVVFGSWSDLDAYDQAYNADRYDPKTNRGYGKIDTVSKLIYINNQAPETVVHELIHAATVDKINAYYHGDRQALDPQDKQAIERLERLMLEWLDQNYSAEGDTVLSARMQAEATVNGYYQEGKVAEAVSEFLAWVLANQNLASVASRTKVKNPLAKIIGDALRAIKELIWGKSKAPHAGDDLLSQMRFNARVLMSTHLPETLQKQAIRDTVLHQSPSFGSSDYLTGLRKDFYAKVVNYLWSSDDPVERKDRRNRKDEALLKATQVADTFHSRGFTMTAQEYSTFRAVNAALFTEADLNANSASRIQDLYDHVIKTIKVEDFMTGYGDPMVDRHQAQEKYDALTGVYGTEKDASGRTSLLSSFLALALTNEEFRGVLSRMEPPKGNRDGSGTLDARFYNLGQSLMDRLSLTMSGYRKGANVQESIDALARVLVEQGNDDRTFIEQWAENGLNGADNYLKNTIQKLSGNVERKANDIIRNNRSHVARGGARAVRAVAALVSEQSADKVALGLTRAMNNVGGLNWVRELVNDVVGRTSENAPIFDMISRVRSAVQQTRQQFRDELPKTIQTKFTRKLSKLEWQALLRALGKTDLAALRQAYGVAGALDLLADPRRLAREIQSLERIIRNTDARRAPALFRKAEQLAAYMNSGRQGVNLLRNAYAVANLYGERGYLPVDPADPLVAQIDQLVTLYAVRDLDGGTRDMVQTLMTDQRDGLEFALSYLVGLRTSEQEKVSLPNSPAALINHYKGYIPYLNQEGASLIVANETEHARLLSMGYQKVADYHGSSADVGRYRKAYYFAPVSGRAPYNQGVMQTVHQTVNGIDPNTGYTTGELTAGRITDPRQIQRILSGLGSQRQTEENLLPVYNDRGQVVAFERGIDPIQVARLNRDTDLSKMIGVWRGRQVEELLAQEFNAALVRNLHGIWQEGKRKGRDREFVDLSKPTGDPVLEEAWNLIPDYTREVIKQTFGRDGFRVRKDMLNDALGYRSASVGDFWTGNTRINPNVANRVQTIAMGMFGNKAYERLVKTEQFTQDLVMNAKFLIVVKSVVVPAANLVSNVYQLVNRGVPVRDVLKGLGAKTAELNDYIKRRKQEIDLEAELLAARGTNNLMRIRTIENEIQAIKDSYRRMSIWPLIEAGEFSAISSGAVTAEDLALAEGRWSNFTDRLVSKIPDGPLRVGYRYAMVTRDTSLFQGLARATQYGDFIAKAVLYDDLTRRQKASKQEALAQVAEEFIPYNRLAGRSRQYLESVGLLWFYNFKLRSMKVAASTIRRNPLRSLLMTGAPDLPLIGSIGTPVTDNFASVLADGRLGYSIGPGMGLNSFSLNPWVNLTN